MDTRGNLASRTDPFDPLNILPNWPRLGLDQLNLLNLLNLYFLDLLDLLYLDLLDLSIAVVLLNLLNPNLLDRLNIDRLLHDLLDNPRPYGLDAGIAAVTNRLNDPLDLNGLRVSDNLLYLDILNIIVAGLSS